jgi:PAS domain S-box-containing protein
MKARGAQQSEHGEDRLMTPGRNDTKGAGAGNDAAQETISEAHFAAIFDAVNDAIMLRDPENGAIVEANARAVEMFGYSRDEFRSLPAGSLSATPGGFDAQNALLAIQRAAREPALYAWQARHRDGHSFWIEINARLAEIDGRRLVLLVARDITRRRMVEEALRLSERLSSLGSLVTGVAHEVRNPLFGITATISAFEAEFGKQPAMTDYAASLRRDDTRLTSHMNDLLEYGRPPELVPRVQPFETIIGEAMRVCAPLAKTRGITVTFDSEGALPRVYADAGRIVQVLKNVIENAIDFSPESGTVTVRARGVDDGSALAVSVSDRGAGFRTDELPRVFDPFYTRRHGGTGLGLPIAQKIVHQHGGQITASNSPSGGGEIEIVLPAITREC